MSHSSAVSKNKPSKKTVSCLAYCSTPKMEVTCSFQTSVGFQRTTQYYIPEDRTLHNHRCENLKSYTSYCNFTFLSDFLQRKPTLGSRDSSDRVATGYGLDGRGSIPSRGKIFLLSTSSSLGPTQPPTQWVPGALSPGVKRPGR
jgi:hypothetical protein